MDHSCGARELAKWQVDHAWAGRESACVLLVAGLACSRQGQWNRSSKDLQELGQHRHSVAAAFGEHVGAVQQREMGLLKHRHWELVRAVEQP